MFHNFQLVNVISTKRAQCTYKKPYKNIKIQEKITTTVNYEHRKGAFLNNQVSFQEMK